MADDMMHKQWRVLVDSEAGRQGLSFEVLEAFDGYVASGLSPMEAASAALYDWDCPPAYGVE